MNNKKYVRGKKRVVIPVSCSKEQKQLIDQHLDNNDINKGFKSQYIVQLILKAINNNYTNLAPSSTNPIDWQISVNPDTKDYIYEWCDRNLPSKSRSKWIVNLILNQP